MWGRAQGLRDRDTGAPGFGQAPSAAQEHPQIWALRAELGAREAGAGLAAQSGQRHTSSLLQSCHPCPSRLCRVALGLQPAQGTVHTGPGRAPLPLGTWHMPCAGLGKQELCPPALPPVGHLGLLLGAVQPQQGAARQERGHPDTPNP